jgi:biopolymer transport protein ExbB/TolQ
MVSAERFFVLRVGSGSPVKGATGPNFGFVVVTGATVVGVVVTAMIVVVVVVSANAPVDAARLEPRVMTKKSSSERRIQKIYSADYVARCSIEPSAAIHRHATQEHDSSLTSNSASGTLLIGVPRGSCT